MACGLATVVFDTPVNREILGELGVYARLGDARPWPRASSSSSGAGGARRAREALRARAVAGILGSIRRADESITGSVSGR